MMKPVLFYLLLLISYSIYAQEDCFQCHDSQPLEIAKFSSIEVYISTNSSPSKLIFTHVNSAREGCYTINNAYKGEKTIFNCSTKTVIKRLTRDNQVITIPVCGTTGYHAKYNKTTIDTIYKDGLIKEIVKTLTDYDNSVNIWKDEYNESNQIVLKTYITDSKYSLINKSEKSYNYWENGAIKYTEKVSEDDNGLISKEYEKYNDNGQKIEKGKFYKINDTLTLCNKAQYSYDTEGNRIKEIHNNLMDLSTTEYQIKYFQ